MKKITRKIAAMAAALTAMMMAGPMTQAYADKAEGDLSFFADIDADSAECRPKLSISEYNMTYSEGTGSTHQFEVRIDDADGKYDALSFQIELDPRLRFEEMDGDPAEIGPAARRMVNNITLISDTTLSVALMGNGGNTGRDGILVVFCVSIAGDVAPGDELPIKIVYKDGQSGISDSTGAKDTPMNAWTFTKGITQGGIKLFHDDCGITGSTLGDCNGDKAIDAVDASMVLSLYAKASTTEKTFTDAEFKVCDINGDRLIDSTDASLILSYYSAVSTNKELSIDEFLK